MEQVWLEDVVLGATHTVGDYEVTREEIVEFAARWDPQPFHLDEEAASESIFGGLTACFVHVFSILSRLTTLQERRLAILAGLGFEESRMLLPVRPGDRLHLEIEHLSKRESRSKPDRGIVESRFTVVNQRDETAMMTRGLAMVARRPA